MPLIVRVASVLLSLLLTSYLANAQGSRVRTFAVAPFENITGNASDEWIGTGIVATLETEIQNAKELVLTDEGTSDRNKADLTTQREYDTNPIADFFASARQQNIDLLLTGNYQRIDDQLRITARLHDVKTGTTVRAFRVDG